MTADRPGVTDAAADATTATTAINATAMRRGARLTLGFIDGSSGELEQASRRGGGQTTRRRNDAVERVGMRRRVERRELRMPFERLRHRIRRSRVGRG